MSTTPLGTPVEPLVYIMMAVSANRRTVLFVSTNEKTVIFVSTNQNSPAGLGGMGWTLELAPMVSTSENLWKVALLTGSGVAMGLWLANEKTGLPAVPHTAKLGHLTVDCPHHLLQVTPNGGQ